MTLVTTTVSKYGITVVADTAVSQRTDDGEPIVLLDAADKIVYSEAANVALACWGSVDFPGTGYYAFLSELVRSRFSNVTSLMDAAELLAAEINERLAPVAQARDGWSTLRRGIHVSGYVNGVPCIYHVHTGAPEEGHHPLRVHCDYPDIYGGGLESFTRSLESGFRMQLFNGFPELFGLIGASLTPLRVRLEKEFGVQIPAPSLRGQLEFDRAIVSLAGGLLRAGDRLPQVSTATRFVAFTTAGLVEMPEITNGVPQLRGNAPTSRPRASDGAPNGTGPWDGGKHGDAFDPSRAT